MPGNLQTIPASGGRLVTVPTGIPPNRLVNLIRANARLFYAEITPETGVSASSANFSKRKTNSNRKYVVYGLNPNDASGMHQMIVDILGNTNPKTVEGGRRGGIERVLPRCDPVWPWLVADEMGGVTGLGVYQPVLRPTNFEVEPIGGWPYYPTYSFNVNFLKPPYGLLNDEKINVRTGQHYFADDGSTVSNVTYAEEWKRFTFYPVDPQFNYVTATAGQMVFRNNAGGDPDPNGKLFRGMPRIALPDYLVRFQWFEVPYRYVISQNSNLNKFQGRLNQNSWYNWPVGALLYLGYRVTDIYSPPVVAMNPVAGGGAGASLVADEDKLCDLEFNFLATKRTVNGAPVPAQGNWISAGHNLLPWLMNKKFHYATVRPPGVDNSAKWMPSWLSFPFELLFTDPDL